MAEKPLPPPSSRVDEPPFVCIQVNRGWIPYLIGVVRPWLYPEAWLGTLAENRQARGDTKNLIYQIQTAEECGMNDCCVNVNVRLRQINPVTFRPEISVDGGETWTPDPNDINNLVTEPAAPVTTGIFADKCDAATNGTEHIRDMVAGISNGLETAGTLAAFIILVGELLLLAILLYITGGVASLAFLEMLGLIAASAKAVFEGGQAAFDAYWTEERYDQMLCILFCNIGEDGKFTDAQYQRVVQAIQTDMPAHFARDIIRDDIKAMGRRGLNVLCSYGNAAAADCASCACGACDLNDWEVVFGKDVVRTDTSVTVTSIFGGGNHTIRVRNLNINDCCCSMASELISGTAPSTIGFVACGQTNDDDTNVGFSYTGQATNLMVYLSTGEFRLRIYSADPCL